MGAGGEVGGGEGGGGEEVVGLEGGREEGLMRGVEMDFGGVSG